MGGLEERAEREREREREQRVIVTVAKRWVGVRNCDNKILGKMSIRKRESSP